MSSLQVESLFGVAGKVVLVTGESRGIGRMVCISSRSAKDCNETAKGLIPHRDLPRVAIVANISSCPKVITLARKLLPLLRSGAAQGGRTGMAFNDPSRIIDASSSGCRTLPRIGASCGPYIDWHRHLVGHLGPESTLSNRVARGPFASLVTSELLDTPGDVLVSQIPSSGLGTQDVAGAALYLSSRAGAYVNAATIALEQRFLVAPTCYIGNNLVTRLAFSTISYKIYCPS
ncbi:hypothetical protein F5I97DRAFT_1936871 [Phlebopus sp. FC_14]|nr:hypothetical protein F5I97DRAFT_1936871 [Phlebopus sp. FC_14]